MLNDYFLRKHFCVCLICVVLTAIEKEGRIWCWSGNLKVAERIMGGETSANNCKIGENARKLQFLKNYIGKPSYSRQPWLSHE